MDAFDQILLFIAFAACFGIAVCLLVLLVDYRKHRNQPEASEAPPKRNHSRDLTGSRSSQRAA